MTRSLPNWNSDGKKVRVTKVTNSTTKIVVYTEVVDYRLGTRNRELGRG